MVSFNAAPWQIEAAWLIAKGTPLDPMIPRSRAMMMLRETSNWDLIEKMRGPVAEAAFKEGGVPTLARFLFGAYGSLKAKYDTSTYGEETREKVMRRYADDGPIVVSGKQWKELLARVEALERWRNHMLTK